MPLHLILEGVNGSRAYGLAHADSDEDRIGVFLTPTLKLLSMYPVDPRAESLHYKADHGDVVIHELSKFCRLAVKCNPAVMELLWLDSYTVTSDVGYGLIELRSAFLFENGVRNGYLSNAATQINRARGQGDTPRARKLLRHARRLMDHATGLITTGHLQVRVSDPADYAEFNHLPLDDAFASLESRLALMDGKTGSLLPSCPNIAKVEKWLACTRLAALVD